MRRLSVKYRENRDRSRNGRTDRPAVGTVNGVGQRNRVLDGRPRRRHVANTVERLCAAAMHERVCHRDGVAACCKRNYFGQFLFVVLLL